LAGLCISLLVTKEKTYFWTAIGGFIMVLIYVTTLRFAYHDEEKFILHIFYYFRSVMFLLGTILGAFTLKKAREKLTKG